MARIRTIKPEFWDDETIGILSHGSRLLFLGCLNLSDDEGLLRWNAMYLGASVFAYDDIKSDTIEKWMAELVNNELIFVYKSVKANQSIGLIVNFHKHQRIDKPQPAKFPAPNWRDVRLKRLIAKRDNWMCHICGEPIICGDSIKKNKSKALSVDHVKPAAKGGNDYLSNLKACHLGCNHSKSDSYDEGNSENDSENDSENTSRREGKGLGKESNSNGKVITPTLDDFRQYCLERGHIPEVAEKAFEYYNSAGWRDSNDKPVKNWKQKLISVWFKPETKIKNNSVSTLQQNEW